MSATGEGVGVARVQIVLQNTLDVLEKIIVHPVASSSNGAATPTATNSSQRLGIIHQRLPTLNYKAAEFADPGYSVLDVNPITGEQRVAVNDSLWPIAA